MQSYRLLPPSFNEREIDKHNVYRRPTGECHDNGYFLALTDTAIVRTTIGISTQKVMTDTTIPTIPETGKFGFSEQQSLSHVSQSSPISAVQISSPQTVWEW